MYKIKLTERVHLLPSDGNGKLRLENGSKVTDFSEHVSQDTVDFCWP